MQPAQFDIQQGIGKTFAYFFKWRYDDGTLRSFDGSTIVFHGQSGDTTFHYASQSAQVFLSDVEGVTEAGLLIKLSYSVTNAWIDGQTFFYQIEEWIGGERYPLIEGNIYASRGVIDGAD